MELSFSRIAIVNRGEPARRLLQAVQELNEEHAAKLHTIALYTEPDRRSLFAREASEALCLGPATFLDPNDGQRKSKYLDYDALERALVQCRAQAAWVGWGFVAEHAEFADLCERLGIVFVGPSGAVMRRLGDKISSKLLAETAGVPVSPWSGGPVRSLEEAKAQAASLGFPLMLKATAGGGGRGVRRLQRLEDLETAFASARSEALKFFGSDVVFLERAIVGARHVEVQVLADGQGSVWPLGVRDCTLQRRNQKVVEEAPCAAIDSQIESRIRNAAVSLAQQAGYSNAGTVEFLFDPASREFYFMEMNTRLQVEHPVTEITTGVDIVKMQLHIASGGRLPGNPPATRGHAIEVRLNAEDADNNFAPAPGRVELFQLPTGPGLRVDTGVRQGDDVSPEFDSMIAKIIAVGSTRSEALGRLRRALQQSVVVLRGGTSNKAFLLELLSHPAVLSNEVDIGWLDRTWAQRSRGDRSPAAVALVRAAIDVYDREFSLEQRRFFVSAARGRPAAREEIGNVAELRYDGETYRLDVRRIGAGRYRVFVEGERLEVSVDPQGEFESWLTCGAKRYKAVSVLDGPHHLVEIDGVQHRISSDQGGVVRAPAPAVVLGIATQVGDSVAAGDRLVVLEAMKMEMAVVAPCSGRVRQILVRANVQVGAGTPLVLLEPETETEIATPKERIHFASTPLGGPLEDDYGVALQELTRLVLGYDLEAKEIRKLAALRKETNSRPPADAATIWRMEDSVLQILADVLALHRRDPASAFEQPLSAEENFHNYLRSVRSAGEGLPESFRDKLLRALRHYGVESLEPTELLDEALVFLYRAYRRVGDSVEQSFGILERRLRNLESTRNLARPEDRALLDQLIDSTHNRFLPVNDLARELKYRVFDRPAFEASRAESYRAVSEAMARLVASKEGHPGRRADLDQVVQCPHPVLGLLARSLASSDPTMRSACLEALLRRHYRLGSLDHLEVEEVNRHSVLSACYQQGSTTGHVVATHARFEDLGAAMAAVGPVLVRYERSQEVALDIYSVVEEVDEEQALQAVSSVLDLAQYFRPVHHICVAVASAATGRVLYSTWEPREQGYEENRAQRHIHPMVAQRLELWRLKNFHLEQVSAAEGIYLYRAVAKENPKDERLFSFVDVRDLTPLRNEQGEVVQLPHLEHMFLEALAGIREFQARRSTRDRLHWNRVLLSLWPTLELTPEEMMRIAKRLAPPTKNLGLEKTVARLRVRDSSGALVDQVLHVSNRAGTGLRLQFDALSEEPVRPLTAYGQKVVQMRRLQMVYPYEIVRMLTPSREGDQAEFPPGEFVEYDLDDQGKLVPVRRPLGENTANIVVGVVRNYTAKHPEGMTRVMVLGDASKEMGALAEPECRRIVEALNLAERQGIPLEWFPVSSGAKIAMDVGTEGLDWVARVLRRIVEFTQAGGEINVVVAGVNVGGQSYWNAEATMLMHTRGILVMTPQGSMVLTGKRALDYSGGVSADTNQGIGGFERIMGFNGQAQYAARDIAEACFILLRHYEHTYVAPGERFPRRARTYDTPGRNICSAPHQSVNGTGFSVVGDVFSLEKNPGRKKPFDIRSVLRATVDQDHEPFERWRAWRNAETAVVWDAHLGGYPVCLIGIESRPLSRLGFVPGDGPDTWTGGTLFPQSSKKVARAINSASGNRPVVVLANLSGFDGSPESMRELQLEYGAEIGRAVVNFDGPLVFCVVSRYHGGAYVVFSCSLNENLQVAAVEGSHASVIGGAPAAAVVFPAEVKSRTLADPRVREAHSLLSKATDQERPRLSARYDELYKSVYSEKQGEVAERFDKIHSVQRAQQVGSLHDIIPASGLRGYLIQAVEKGIDKTLSSNQPASHRKPVVLAS